MVLAEPQPACWAETTVYTSRSIAAVTVTAPGISNLRPPRAARSPRGISQKAAASTITATGAGTSRVHRQLISVRTPDSTSPSEKPLAPKTV